MGSVPHLPTGETFATMYAPLEKAPFTPQVIIIVGRPWAMLKLAQSSLFRMGGRAHADFSGIQSVCSDSAAETYLTGKPNFSLGCDGSRTFSGITDDEMVMGFPAEMLPESCGRPAGCRQGARVVEEIRFVYLFQIAFGTFFFQDYRSIVHVLSRFPVGTEHVIVGKRECPS